MTFKEHLAMQAVKLIPMFLWLTLFEYMFRKWGHDFSKGITNYGTYFLVMPLVIIFIAALAYWVERCSWFAKPKKIKDLFKSI